MRLTNKPILALACALAAVSTVAGCSKATNNAAAGGRPKGGGGDGGSAEYHAAEWQPTLTRNLPLAASRLSPPC
jgi:hypothetical protein